jgi:hypothetical protein
MAEKQQNQFVEIVFSCVDDKFYKDEIILDHHSLARVISGEMKIIQADSTFLLGPGSTFLYPRNQPATVIKYPKDGQRFQSVSMKLTPERLKDFYTRNPFPTSLHAPTRSGTLKNTHYWSASSLRSCRTSICLMRCHPKWPM